MLRWLRRAAPVAAVAVVAAALAAYLILRGSLPRIDGRQELAGLAGEVVVERDGLGVPTLRASSRVDAARALGYLHGQERFFQMDLQRRRAAGELAELFGAVALEADRAARLHRFRARAREVLAGLPPADRAIARAYSAGVNAGLDALASRPFEYWLLRAAPQTWLDEDLVLTIFAMYLQLNDADDSREAGLAELRAALPAPVYAWMIQSGTDWDAPLVGGPVPAVPLPGPEVYDLRRLDGDAFDQVAAADCCAGGDVAAGSNNWAVAGTHTAHGGAIVTGDMHLGLNVPNIWYRARLVVKPGAGPAVDVTGVTLPGAPMVVAGSNGHVAWAYTNSYGDWVDLVELTLDPADAGRYRAPDGFRPFTEHVERIAVRGAADDQLLVRETVWGPVVGRGRALRWLAHEPEATNLRMRHLETVRDVDEALAAAAGVGGPPQNFVVADADGRIGWTILGRIPRRTGYDPLMPAPWPDGTGWQGWLHAAEYPRLVDPPAGRLWTANARTVSGEWLALLGEGRYALGARARQVRDGLLALAAADERDMLRIQLDDRALFLARWRGLLLETLAPDAVAGHPQRAELRRLVDQWSGRAGVDAAGYRLLRAFRYVVSDAVVAALTAELRQLRGVATIEHSQLERPVWQLVSERPPHLLNPRYPDWDSFLLAAADAVIAAHAGEPGGLAARTWGERNVARIAHPLTRALPALGRFLDMPSEALAGDSHMPRVQGPAFGASQRMAVSPGREDAGYFHMPGGQSGHPLSPYYRAGHVAWVRGEPMPFLPGEARHRLVLAPPR